VTDASGRTLSSAFRQCLSGARAVDRLAQGRTVVGLFALGRLARQGDDGTSKKLWRELRNGAVHPLRDYRPDRDVVELARYVEHRYPDLTGVFTEILLADLASLRAMLTLWIILIHQHDERYGAASDSEFGRWLGQAIDDLADGPFGAEIATPPDVARLMVACAGIQADDSVLDPCCGLGATLAAVVDEADQRGIAVRCFGQEVSAPAFALGALRLFFRNRTATIRLADALRQSAFQREGQLETFDRVLCDPPMGLKVSDRDLILHESYRWMPVSRSGRMSSDSVFLQCAFASLKPQGRAVVFVPPGILFRGGNDAYLREYLVQKDVVSAIIGLPPGMVAGTAIETAVIVLDKAKPEHLRDRILFVDASKARAPGRGRSRLLPSFLASIPALLGPKPVAIDASVIVVPRDEVLQCRASLQPRRYLPSDGQRKRESVATKLDRARALERTAARLAQDMDRLTTMWERTSEGRIDEGVDV
jgi:type I restriction enzyme M protein